MRKQESITFAFNLLFVVCIVGISLLSGCAPQFSSKDLPTGIALVTEIKDFPFFEQERYQCAPAAAAMVLTHQGKDARPQDLTTLMFTPDKRGSFQADLIGALRRWGRIPYRIDGEIGSLLEFVSIREPVIVLLNLGLESVPKFHYGVIIGYDLTNQRVTFTSGREKREYFSFDTFLRMWKRVDQWGIVVLDPGEIPDFVEPLRYYSAVTASEELGFIKEAKQNYLAALSKFGPSATVYLSMGNIALREDNFTAASEWFEKALQLEPYSSILLNNSAWSLAHTGRFKEAYQRAIQALELDRGECGKNCRDTLDFITRNQ